MNNDYPDARVACDVPYKNILAELARIKEKAARGGDTSAAKFIKEITGEGASMDDTGISDLRSLSDVVLCRLAGFTREKLMQSEM